YDLLNPYCAVLAQSGYGYPGQAQPAFHRGMDQFRRLCAAGDAEPLLDRNGFPEVRLLPERPAAHADCEQLFDALRRAKEVTEASLGAFCLTRPEDGLAHHFHDVTLTPAWHPATVFHGALRQREFGHFVAVRVEVAGWNRLWARLRDHGDAEEA